MLHYSTGFTPMDKVYCTLSTELDPVLLLSKSVTISSFWRVLSSGMALVLVTLWQIDAMNLPFRQTSKRSYLNGSFLYLKTY